MDTKRAVCELMQIYGCLSSDKQIAIDTLINAAERRKGHWTSTICYARTDNGILLIGLSCSECGKITYFSPPMRTPECCPFCMTEMKEGSEHEKN